MLQVITGFGGFALLLLFSMSSDEQERITDPFKIIAQHFEALGGLEKVKAEKSHYYEATVEIEGTGLKGTLKEWRTFPLLERQELDLQIVKQISGDNGTFTWRVDENRKLQVNKDETSAKNREVKRRYELYEHLQTDSDFFVVQYVGQELLGDTPCSVITIANSLNAQVTTNYYDLRTMFLIKTVVQETDHEMVTVFSDFQEVDGVIHPFRQEVTILPLGQKQIITITTFEVKSEIDPVLFEPPSEDVRDFSFSENNCSENIPFQFIEHHIYLPVTVRGKEGLWVLDSGASKTVIDTEYRARLSLPIEGKLKGQGAGSTVDVSFTTLPAFQLSGLQVSEQKIVAIKLKDLFHRLLGLEVVGILGYDFLSRFVTKIDYAHENLSLYDPDHFKYEGPGTVIAAPLQNNMFHIPLTVDGTYSGKWTLDLGATGLSFHYPYAVRNKLLDRPGLEEVGFGAGGELKSRISRFDQIEFAGYSLDNFLISCPLVQGQGAFSQKKFAGNIGNSLLQHFVLYLDYAGQRIIVEKGDKYNQRSPRDKSGLSFQYNAHNGLEVFFVSPRTPAAKADFRKGDVLRKVNNIDLDLLRGPRALRTLLRQEAGTKYTFTVMREGKELEIKLKLKDLF